MGKPKSVITRRHVVKRDEEGRILDVVEENILEGEHAQDAQLTEATAALKAATEVVRQVKDQQGVTANEIAADAADAVVDVVERHAEKAAAAAFKRLEDARVAKAAAAVKKNAEMESWGRADYGGADRDATTFSTVKKSKKPIAHDSAESFRGPAAEAAFVEDEKVRKFLGDGEKFLRDAVQMTSKNLLAVAKATITVCKIIGRIDAIAELERLKADIQRLIDEGAEYKLTADPPVDDTINVHLWRKKAEKVAMVYRQLDDLTPAERERARDFPLGPARWRRK